MLFFGRFLSSRYISKNPKPPKQQTAQAIYSTANPCLGFRSRSPVGHRRSVRHRRRGGQITSGRARKSCSQSEKGDDMPRYYCDYCGTYLTHDSAPGRRQHNRGEGPRLTPGIFVVYCCVGCIRATRIPFCISRRGIRYATYSCQYLGMRDSLTAVRGVSVR